MLSVLSLPFTPDLCFTNVLSKDFMVPFGLTAQILGWTVLSGHWRYAFTAQCYAERCNTASRLSVSVTLRYRDHIGWKSSQKISPLVSLGCSLSQTQTSRVCSKGEHPTVSKWPGHVEMCVLYIRWQIAAGRLENDSAIVTMGSVYEPPSLFPVI